jgi:hypothetical protein
MAKKRASSLSNEISDEFYSLIQDRQVQLELFDSPERIWNEDETAFDSSSSNRRVLAPKGNRVDKVTNNNEKISYTVNVCCNASGKFLPFYVLYPGKNVYTTWTEGGPDNCRFNFKDLS